MTPARLAEIRHRLALAAGAPWHARPALGEMGYSTHVVCLDAGGGCAGEEADVWLHGRNVTVGLCGDAADFVAHAPEDIAALLAEVERLSAKPERVARWESEPFRYPGYILLLGASNRRLAQIGRPWPARETWHAYWRPNGRDFATEPEARRWIEAEAARKGWTVAK